MANVKKDTQATNTRATDHNNNKKAKNKDTTDSRKNEEFDYKGDDITHNKKVTRSDK